ncbi:mitochondrial pyruvate dehydrogenase [Niveomyces insectorum RCEF 264]|uniref:Protein-serine/threonine kinase n=1 Tax=Niveomyces insectorum RCEF 264 TaxID=1081102 RepID=A0A162LBS9_9HYPO|nr:mitochondrial pyruvate dehydrogenase [Niveomyces insectorum RCEF 264]
MRGLARPSKALQAAATPFLTTGRPVSARPPLAHHGANPLVVRCALSTTSHSRSRSDYDGGGHRHKQTKLTPRHHDHDHPPDRPTSQKPQTAAAQTTTTTTTTGSQDEEPPPLHDEDIARLAKEPQHQLRLADLVRHGWPPLGEEALLQSANFALELIPVRLARRLQALRNLPYIVASNTHVRRIYGNYRHSLRALLPWWRRRAAGAITTLEEEIAFTDVLAELVTTHQNTIPILAQGFLECRKYIAPADVTAFLDEHLRARIGTRLIAEQHIALHLSSQPFNGAPGPGGSDSSSSSTTTTPTTHKGYNHNDDDTLDAPSASFPPAADPPSSYIGIIDTQLRPARTIDSCAGFVADICELKYGVRPHWRIDGEPATTFAYVPMHLEYIVTELLKNAFRAVVENKMHREPVVITIAPEPPLPPPANRPHPPSHEAATTATAATAAAAILPLDDNAPGVTIRIRDRGGGISTDVLPNIWSYSFTTFSELGDLPGSATSSSNSSSNNNNNNGDANTATNSANSINSNLSNGSDGASDGLNILSASNQGGSSIAGLGYGLPLSRAYAEYFGGGIAIQSLHGWGTDVYLRLKGVGNIE